MKVGYRKPAVEFEDYELNAAIANGCQVKVTFGPEPMGEYGVCKEYEIDLFSMYDTDGEQAHPFVDENVCYCSLNAVGDAIFTS